MDWQIKKLAKMKLIKDLKQQRGAIIILSALMLPIMLGLLGFAYDFGNMYMHKVRLQNIADAAALAGGRAFLESRKKVENRDTVDTKVDEQFGRGEVTYTVGGSIKPRLGTYWHPEADAAADATIMRNIVNLGTPVTCDIFSHYALKTEGLNPKTFYRIGLYENVPLYFLSVLRDKKVQKVRAGTVVYIDDGKGFAVGKSLFDNLFVVGDQGISLGDDVAVDSDTGKIKATFDGDIVIATDENNWKSSTLKKDTSFYTAEEKGYQLDNDYSIDTINSNPNMGGRAVRDNSIAIDSSVSGFLRKLEEQHFDVKKNCFQKKSVNYKVNSIKASDLNNSLRTYEGRLSNHYTITTDVPPTDNQPARTDIDYYHEDDNKRVSCLRRDPEDVKLGKAYERVKNGPTDIFYSFYSEGYRFKYKDNNGNTQGPVTCFTYVIDNNNNQIFCNYDKNNDNNWKFYRKIVTTNEDSSREVVYQQLDATKHSLQETTTAEEKKNLRKWSYVYDRQSCEFIINKVTFNDSKRVKVNEAQITNANIFHWESDGWEDNVEDIPLSLEVDGLEGNDSYPLYIILTGNEVTPIKMEVTQSNDRPVIFCNLTTNEIHFSIFTPEDAEKTVFFKGMIYSPFAKVVNAPVSGSTGGRFIGNIVAKELVIQDGSITWAHKNYLADDSDLNEVSDNAATAQEQRKPDAIEKAKEYYSTELTKLGLSDADWDDPDWFGNLSKLPEEDDEAFAKRKKKYQTAWNEARQALLNDYGLDMPDWPWKDGGKTTDINKHHYRESNYFSNTTVEIVRIINFRTEYRTDPYIDPFTHLYLPDD